MRLKNKVIAVTASTRGIGYAIVTACAQEGAIVYMAARNQERAQARIEAFQKTGYTVKYVYNDASKPETYRTMIDDIVQAEGHIDVLVNNFGTSDPKVDLDIAHTNPDTFIDTVNMNLKSVFISSQSAIQYMAKGNGGSIINISSIGGLVPDISQVAYGTSKAAINYLTKLIAVQEARHQIRCNAVLPGMTATDAVKDNLSDNFNNLFMKHIPLERMAKPEEIAAAVVYFASDDSAYTTGQILTVSGGFGLATPIFGDLNSQANQRG
ncbi:DP-dependent 7-alpha-hydroxysteroid dehydrogenase [Agrilactobacillus composti DSM 18527 = JCM 14202]|uniref:DP-dependent 7-alpha-hydroxysteroid dehydrogenase n=1 Tax=Agrilactobacillus composti DSM 18527 = JCM 14202 TaxID=1423734 RepID=A0A0R1XS31_9LACO|nr:SDR family oxidoreductase [Agrilactobacillus composti]KRM33032.1 DP-dependent 7-alpha-hydroxysteroid dehydrogenase [Agrilactobacillus composti DSM 18527 = JCM 14202]